MAENQKTDLGTSNGAAPAQPILEQPQRDWVTPQFECIPLSEAMGPQFHHVVQDGANLYS